MFVLSLLDHGRGLPYRASIIEPIAKRFENLKLPQTGLSRNLVAYRRFVYLGYNCRMKTQTILILLSLALCPIIQAQNVTVTANAGPDESMSLTCAAY
jgi:hypothetical protein